MKAKENPNFDYLRGFVKDQLTQLRRFGPIVYEIFETLETSGSKMPLDPLIERVVSQPKVVVRVDADALNLRAGPSIQSPIVKVVNRGVQLLLTDSTHQTLIGRSGVWLHVLDMEGYQGYVNAQYVSFDREYSNPQAKVESLMFTLESFDRMELVSIDPNYGIVHLTNKGESVARLLIHND
jgi:hypothetical protein